MAVLPKAPPPITVVPLQQKVPMSPVRVDVLEATPKVAPAPPPRVDPLGNISFQQGRAPRRPPQRSPHIISDDTEPMPPLSHQNAKGNPSVPQIYRYNTHAHQFQGQYLMKNHLTTINTPTYAPSKPAPPVFPTVEDWEVIYQATGNLTLRPGMMNAVI